MRSARNDSSPAVWSHRPRNGTAGPNRVIASLTISIGFV